uniref:Uncharacterized protein n=1 Tax=Arundo donax TaxID=35708 RepID=A0A0A8YGS9_ARUDO
MGIDGSFSSQG